MSNRDDIEAKVLALFHQDKWQEIIELKDAEDNFEKLKLLWVWPGFSDLSWIKEALEKRNCKGIVSIGCGSGLLEWLIQRQSGLDVMGVEVDRLWWQSKYSPPVFLKNVVFIDDENNNFEIPQDYALLFCYFNNGTAFFDYVRNYRGNVVLVIGPGDGRGSSTDPTPFDGKFHHLGWRLATSKEIRNTKDHVSVHVR